MPDLLFDEDDADEVVNEADAWSRKLIVGEPLANPEDLNLIEQEYRMNFKTPILFEDDDGDGPYLGNPGTMARAMGVDAAGLTLEAAQQWLDEQWLAAR